MRLKTLTKNLAMWLLCGVIAFTPAEHAEAGPLSSLLNFFKRAGQTTGDDVVESGSRAGARAGSTAARVATSGLPSALVGKSANLFESLTQKFLNGEMTETIGRRVEIRDLMENLLRQSNGHALVIGERGVGKSQLVNGLVETISRGDSNTAQSLRQSWILKLNREEISRGSTVAGNVEAHLEEVAQSLLRLTPEEQARVIVVIEDVDQWARVLGGENRTIDLFMAKIESIMDQSRVRFIMTGTHDEVTRVVAARPIYRRFGQVALEPPSLEETFNIIRPHVAELTRSYNVVFPEDLLVRIIDIAPRYIDGVSLPGSAIELLERVALYMKSRGDLQPRALVVLTEKIRVARSQLHLNQGKNGPYHARARQRLLSEIDNMEGQVQTLTSLHEQRIRYLQEVEPLTLEVERLERLISETSRTSDRIGLEESLRRAREELGRVRRQADQHAQALALGNQVDEIALAEAIASMKNVSPEGVLAQISGSSVFMDEASQAVLSRIVGQRHAVEPVLRHLRYTLDASAHGHRGAFMFAGPSRTGKTEFARELAKEVGEGNVLRINLGDYKDATAINGLRGSNAGFVGYEDGGILTNFAASVEGRPSVLILDEAEKGHSTIFDILQSVLDAEDPHILNNHGQKISTRNMIVVVTSNALQGPQDPFTQRALVNGLIQASDFSDDFVRTMTDPQQHSDHIKGLLRTMTHENGERLFRDELLNRFDYIFKFFGFTRVEMADLVRVMFRSIQETFERANIGLSLSDDIVEALALRSGHVEANSARIPNNLRNFVQSRINEMRSQNIIMDGDLVHVSLKAGTSVENVSSLNPSDFQRLFEFNVYGVRGGGETLSRYVIENGVASREVVLNRSGQEERFQSILESFGWVW